MKGNYAFISFEEHEGAVAAIEKMNGKPFQG
jgi:RNA recognition motif-containing protein